MSEMFCTEYREWRAQEYIVVMLREMNRALDCLDFFTYCPFQQDVSIFISVIYRLSLILWVVIRFGVTERAGESGIEVSSPTDFLTDYRGIPAEGSGPEVNRPLFSSLVGALSTRLFTDHRAPRSPIHHLIFIQDTPT